MDLSLPLYRCILGYLEDLEDHLGQEYQEARGSQGSQLFQGVLLSLLCQEVQVLQYHPFVLGVHVAPRVLASQETQ